jgi:ribosome-associated translation inhibitor RaiA
MTIQFNTDKTISGVENNSAPFIAQISDELKRFSSHITRIEVHLSDENGNKDKPNDIRCLMEARLEGKQPIAVTNQADTMDQAVSGAIDKIKASLETIIGRDKNY